MKQLQMSELNMHALLVLFIAQIQLVEALILGLIRETNTQTPCRINSEYVLNEAA